MSAPPAIHLAPTERAVLEALADGAEIAEAATALGIKPSTASSYLRSARRRLHDAGSAPWAVAIAYAVNAISTPPKLNPADLDLSRARRSLVPFLAHCMTSTPSRSHGKRRTIARLCTSTRMLEQGHGGVAEEVRGGLVPGHQEQDRQRDRLLLAEMVVSVAGRAAPRPHRS